MVDYESYDPILFDQAAREYEEAAYGSSLADNYLGDGTEAMAAATAGSQHASATATETSQGSGFTKHYYFKESEKEEEIPATTAHFHSRNDSDAALGKDGQEDPDAILDGALAHDYDSDAALQEDQESAEMQLAMMGLAAFGMVLFVMWYMLRSCKNNKDEAHGGSQSDADGANSSRSRYRPAPLSPYQNAGDDDIESVPQVELGGFENNY